MEAFKMQIVKAPFGVEVALESLEKKSLPEQMDTRKLKLDVGCGAFPDGDVNIDFYIDDIGHRTGKANIIGQKLNPNRIKGFMKLDLNKSLPFDDEFFDEVVCNHTIEHVENPFQLLREMVRVSSCKVNIICPHRYGDRMQGKNPFHRNFLSKGWFFGALEKIPNCYGKVEYTKHLPLLPFIPLEMRVEIRKN